MKHSFAAFPVCQILQGHSTLVTLMEPDFPFQPVRLYLDCDQDLTGCQIVSLQNGVEEHVRGSPIPCRPFQVTNKFLDRNEFGTGIDIGIVEPRMQMAIKFRNNTERTLRILPVIFTNVPSVTSVDIGDMDPGPGDDDDDAIIIFRSELTATIEREATKLALRKLEKYLGRHHG